MRVRVNCEGTYSLTNPGVVIVLMPEAAVPPDIPPEPSIIPVTDDTGRLYFSRMYFTTKNVPKYVVGNGGARMGRLH